MHFTQYALAYILALPSLTLSAPLPSIPNDASPLDGRDPKFVTNLDHFLSTYGRVPFSAAKPTRDVDAGLGIERRDPKTPILRPGPTEYKPTGLDAMDTILSGLSGASPLRITIPKTIGEVNAMPIKSTLFTTPKDKKGKRDVDAGEGLEARRVGKVMPTRRSKFGICKAKNCDRYLPSVSQSIPFKLGLLNN
ncbi:hypothetical protein B0O99DRAFT_600506 [Bisporella sp. PMI_857]|nr:hypothetical protein B0O99DRAFT_600506 [Bisporella sp. PMI_857]